MTGCQDSLAVCPSHAQRQISCMHCEPGMSGIQDVELSAITARGSHAAVQQTGAWGRVPTCFCRSSVVLKWCSAW